jgi:TRAP-type C4-dicarboxylate transport system permease large subunit
MGFVGLPRHLAEFITALNLSPFALVLALTVFYLILGCFLDGISMVVLTIGVLLPTVQAAGFDLVWFGIFTVLLVELAQITPPVGLNLFVLQGLTRHDLTFVARAAIPMFFLMLLAALLSYYFQDVILWLPNRM